MIATPATMAIALVLGFGLSAASMWLLLPALRRLKFGQHAYEDAPKSHQVKTGTPTMGGVVFVVALLPLLFGAFSGVALFCIVAACAAIGFADDYVSIRRGRNAGLRACTKYLLTALAAAAFLVAITPMLVPQTRDAIFTSGKYSLHVAHWIWLLLGILAISGTIHAVNLTDGLDGLAAGTMVAPLLALSVTSVAGVAVSAMLGIGACIGFLLYNRHPAKVFMGDTGSLALGALLSGLAILSGEMLLLIVIGGVFVAEALSVIIQVMYFKRSGGKRIFKMSPLHHHFELSGWAETKVTSRFWIASAVCSLVGAALIVLVGSTHV